MARVEFIQGNRACVEGAIAAGMRFFAGYPITPSTEIAELASEMLPKVGGKYIQMEDEIASMAAVIGASLTGVKSMTATSGPGFSLKQENIGFASFTEVPCVIINVMRGGPSTGLPTLPAQSDVMQAKWGSHGDHPVIALAPASVDEMFHFTVKAFNLAEKYRVPVILLTDEVIAHMREKIEIPDKVETVNRKRPDKTEEFIPYQSQDDSLVPPMVNFGEGYKINVTGLTHDIYGFPTLNPEKVQQLQQRLYDKIHKNLDDIISYKEYFIEDAEIVIVSFGSSARSSYEAVCEARKEGIKVGMLVLTTIWPFPDNVIRKLAERAKKIIVVEMNMGQILLEVERASRGRCDIVSCLQVNGELISPDTVYNRIKEL